jgi:amino acid transporter
VIAMQNLGVEGLPHLVNALLITSIFSAGNTYIYVATRTLYGLSLEGRAPAVLRKCTKSGVPIYCLVVVMLFAFLSFLQLSAGTAQVLTWLINLITGVGVVNYMVMATTYLFFHRACAQQGIDRRAFPYFARFQPWSTWVALVAEGIILIFYGYATFLPGWFTLADFFAYYTVVGLCPILYIGWKVIKRTKFVKPTEADLVWERPVIDAYEASIISKPIGFWTEMGQLIGLYRHVRDDERI